MKRGEEAVYGSPPAELAAVAADAVQVSPLIPGVETLEALPDTSLARAVILAPPGTLERRYALAHALRALRPGGEMVALAPKTRGGARLAGELAGFGVAPREDARRHHRICRLIRPAAPFGLDEAIAAGAPRIPPGLGLWSQPGVFSWDRLDPGTALLLEWTDGLSGRGADLGCGVGILGKRVLESQDVRQVLYADIDRRAIDAARRNIVDLRARFLHGDLRAWDAPAGAPDMANLDFVIMNPPFHAGGAEDGGLGLAFISVAARILRPGGVCRLVANVALPYETTLAAVFSTSTILTRAGGYKILEAVK